MRRFLLPLIFLVMTAVASPALAQASPPFGFWTTGDNVSRLMVEASGQCSFFSAGGAQLAGSCTWDPSSRGGILTIWIPSAIATTSTSGMTPVRYNIVYVDNTTITVWGEVFYLR
jgi:hypothetical protein